MQEPYTFHTHLHNYAVWTAARASQRNFESTENIKAAINATSLLQFVKEEGFDIQTIADYDKYHREVCNELIEFFKNNGLRKCTYGRAAKIVAIYLKTAVILPNQGQGNLSAIIHPPIDAILLKALHKKPQFTDLKLNQYRWTLIDEDEYWKVWTGIREGINPPFWKLEASWEAA